MFKFFVRLVIYITLIIILVILGVMYNELKRIDTCKKEYTYIDMKGNKGVSRHCFEDGDTYICRDIKHGVRAIKIQEKRVCKDEFN